MSRRLRIQGLCSPVTRRTRALHAASDPHPPAAVGLTHAYLWTHLHSLSPPAQQHRLSRSHHCLFASRSAFSTASDPWTSGRSVTLTRTRSRLLRDLRRESDLPRVLAIVDVYRNAVAALPQQDDIIDINANQTDAVVRLAANPYVSPLDYCVLIFHLLRVGAMDRAAALINEMNVRGLSIRAPIRALFAHHLIVAGRLDKAREVLGPNLGDPARIFRLHKSSLEAEAEAEAEDESAVVRLPPAVSILLMSPDDAPFFRSELFLRSDSKYEQRRKIELAKRVEQHAEVPTVRCESMVACFDFLRGGGYLEPHLDCYHHVMRRVAEAGDTAQCKQLFAAMHQAGVRPNTESYLYLMQTLLRQQLGAVSLTDLLRAKAIQQQPRTQHELAARPDELEAKSHQWQLLKLQLLALHQEMRGRSVPSNHAIYTLLLQLCCLVNDSNRAWPLLDDVRAKIGQIDLPILYALLTLLSVPPRRAQQLLAAAVQLDGLLHTHRALLSSAVRRRSGAEIVQLLDQFAASEAQRLAFATAVASEEEVPSLAALYKRTLAACNLAGMYDVSTQLFTKMSEAAVPATGGHHLAFVQALCRSNRVALALAHVEQMPAASDLLPSLADYCTVICAAADMPPSDERTRLLTDTANLPLFASALLRPREGAQTLTLDAYTDRDNPLFDGTTMSTVVRGLVLWLQWCDGDRFGERPAGECALRLWLNDWRCRAGVREEAAAVLRRALSAASADALVWRSEPTERLVAQPSVSAGGALAAGPLVLQREASERWVLQLSVSAAKEVRKNGERERAGNSATSSQWQPFVQPEAERTDQTAKEETSVPADRNSQLGAALVPDVSTHRLQHSQ